MSAGFTLIELVAMIVILAVLSAAAIPAMQSMSDTRCAMAAKQLLRDVTFARQRAVATGVNTWVEFDAGAETWTVLSEDPANIGRANATVLDDPGTGRTFVQELNGASFTGVTIVSVAFDDQAVIGFDWLGRPLNSAESALAATGQVTLTGNHRISVNATTGHVMYLPP